MDRAPPNAKRQPNVQLVGLGSKQAVDCQAVVCALKDVYSPLQSVPKSVDLSEYGLLTRPKDQLKCGSCWAFGTVAALENAILRSESLPPFWAAQRSALNLSELFLGVNTRGSANFCDGGDFYYAINYISQTKQTVELATNFAYNQTNVDAYKAIFRNGGSVKPKLQAQEQFQPFQTFGEQQIPLISLHYMYDAPNYTFNATVRTQIKSYLAKGIAVVGGMFINTDASKFYSYSGGILEGKCSSQWLDHQVVIVGYGKKEGRDVWMLRNSYGVNWGHEGYFYVPVGENAFCTEMEAEVIIPKSFNNTVFTNFNKQRSYWQLSADYSLVDNDGSISPASFYISTEMIIIVAAGGVLLVLGVCVAAICIVRQRK